MAFIEVVLDTRGTQRSSHNHWPVSDADSADESEAKNEVRTLFSGWAKCNLREGNEFADRKMSILELTLRDNPPAFNPVSKPQTKLDILLRGAFSDEEREFLTGHPRFQRVLAEYTGTLDDFEKIAALGHDLIEKYHGDGPAKPLERRRSRKS